MDLKDCWGKKVKIIDIDGVEFNGTVSFYTDPPNDPDGIENITLYNGNNYIRFEEDEISSIKIIND